MHARLRMAMQALQQTVTHAATPLMTHADFQQIRSTIL
jgi:hypothetical protein